MGNARTKAQNKYITKAYDRVNLVLRKDTSPTKDEVQAAADAAGESMNYFITTAIKQRIEGAQSPLTDIDGPAGRIQDA